MTIVNVVAMGKEIWIFESSSIYIPFETIIQPSCWKSRNFLFFNIWTTSVCWKGMQKFNYCWYSSTLEVSILYSSNNQLCTTIVGWGLLLSWRWILRLSTIVALCGWHSILTSLSIPIRTIEVIFNYFV